jgi:hypothetical protein
MRSRLPIAIVLAIAALSCNRTSPSNPTPTPTPATLSAIRIIGLPATLTEGDSVQLTAIGVWSDGSERPVDPGWSVGPFLTAEISSSGLLLVKAAVRVTVRASFQNITTVATVDVLSRPITPQPPPATFDINGVVVATHDNSPLAGASVVISAGPDGGRGTTTDAHGRFTFSSIVAPRYPGFALRVSKSGYRDASYRVLTLPRDSTPRVVMEGNVGCGYAADPPVVFSFDHVRNGTFDVVTTQGCHWTVDVIQQSQSGSFQFLSATAGDGPARVTYNAFSNYGYDPYVFLIRITGSNGNSAIYTVAVASR